MKSCIQKILTLCLFASTLSVSSADDKKKDERDLKRSMRKGENFAEIKSHVLKMIEGKQKNLATTKACVEKASDHEALKSCRKEAKGERPGFGEEHNAMRSDPPPPPPADAE